MIDGNRPVKVALTVIAVGALILPGNLFGILGDFFFIDISSGKDFECQPISVIVGDKIQTATALARRYCTGDIDQAAAAIKVGAREETLGKGDIIQLP